MSSRIDTRDHPHHPKREEGEVHRGTKNSHELHWKRRFASARSNSTFQAVIFLTKYITHIPPRRLQGPSSNLTP